VGRDLIAAASEAVPFSVVVPEMVAMEEADPEERNAILLPADGREEMVIGASLVGVDGCKGRVVEGWWFVRPTIETRRGLYRRAGWRLVRRGLMHMRDYSAS
jgi:hypothetical protein